MTRLDSEHMCYFKKTRHKFNLQDNRHVSLFRRIIEVQAQTKDTQNFINIVISRKSILNGDSRTKIDS